MNNKYISIVLGVALVAVLVFTFVQKTDVVPVETDGASAGTEYTNTEYFNASLVEGGVTSTSTVNATVPLRAGDFDNESFIDVMLNTQSATLSFPASSTMGGILTRNGQSKKLIIRNATTSSAISLTITGGTGVLLKTSTSTGSTITGDTDGGNHAVLTLMRLANSNFVLSLDSVRLDR